LQSNASQTGTASVSVGFPSGTKSAQSAPIKLGTSGGNSTDSVTNTTTHTITCCSGTLGSLVKRGTNFYVLSNNHVLAKSDKGAAGDPITQPGLVDNNCSGGFLVANLNTFAPVNSASAGFKNVDAALGLIVPTTVDTSGAILDLGAPGTSSIAAEPPSGTLFTSDSTASPVPVGTQVSKVGRTTGLTCSTVSQIGNITVSYDSQCGGTQAFSSTFTNQVIIDGATFSGGGDSGSLIVSTTQARPIGLLYAGNSTLTAANPIDKVLAALTTAEGTPAVMGGADHAVSCAATAPSSVSFTASDVSRLSPEQVLRARNARELAAAQLTDRDISQIEVGTSADNPNESALLVHVDGNSRVTLPATIQGVRTRVLRNNADGTQFSLLPDDFSRGMTLKDKYSETMLGRSGVFGVGIGMSADNPGEPAIVISVDSSLGHQQFPAVLDGMRTKIVESEPFRANGWNARLEPKSIGCAKPPVQHKKATLNVK
jgi:hypothetical protein